MRFSCAISCPWLAPRWRTADRQTGKALFGLFGETKVDNNNNGAQACLERFILCPGSFSRQSALPQLLLLAMPPERRRNVRRSVRTMHTQLCIGVGSVGGGEARQTFYLGQPRGGRQEWPVCAEENDRSERITPSPARGRSYQATIVRSMRIEEW